MLLYSILEKMKIDNLLFCAVSIMPVLLFSIPASGQALLEGTVRDAQTEEALEFVTIMAYDYYSNNILSYTQTDSLGKFSLQVPVLRGIVTIKTSRLGYMAYKQDIVISESSKEDIQLQISLVPEAIKGKEVVVTASPPIIVKKDTVIYDVSHWQEGADQTLEEVLKKIPGFKISWDGEIEVDGKKVNKVIIDGQELANNGAALITRSITPDDVDKIELRTDEQDNQLKESLLDADKFVVLDIKLKSSLKKSLFGKLRLTAGLQNNFEPGGYLNVFSLTKSRNVHLFAESDRFGEETIPITNIKNIGKEATQKIFELPASFEELTEKENFNEELYGFKDYQKAHRNIIGLSVKQNISDNWQLYLGSYNNFNLDQKGRSFLQVLDGNRIGNFDEVRLLRDHTSKNKVELRYDTKKIKLRMDFNAVFVDNRFSNNNQDLVGDERFRFTNEHTSTEIYNNLFGEMILSKKVGLQLRAAYADVNILHDKALGFRSSGYSDFFNAGHANPDIANFDQDIRNAESDLNIEALIQANTFLGTLQLGGRFTDRIFFHQKDAFIYDDNTEAVELEDFSVEKMDFNTTKSAVFLAHEFFLGGLNLENEIALSNTVFPSLSGEDQSLQTWEVKSDLNYMIHPVGVQVIAAYKNTLEGYALSKLVRGIELIDFQTLMNPAVEVIRPQRQEVFQLILDKTFDAIQLNVSSAYVMGRINQNNQFLLSNNASPFINLRQAQLGGNYHLFSLAFTKEFKDFPLQLILEPEMLNNKAQNKDLNGDFYSTISNRYLLGLKMKTLIRNGFFNVFMYPKFSSFEFKNDLTGFRSRQNMFSLECKTDFNLIKDKLFFSLSARNVSFTGEQSSNYFNLLVELSGKINKMRWFVMADNLTNSGDFVQQAISPSFFVDNRTFVFGRFVKAGVSFKFN